MATNADQRKWRQRCISVVSTNPAFDHAKIGLDFSIDTLLPHTLDMHGLPDGEHYMGFKQRNAHADHVETCSLRGRLVMKLTREVCVAKCSSRFRVYFVQAPRSTIPKEMRCSSSKVE